MKLEKDVNYIVSGLERSGTSMIMQILKAGEIPIGYDDSRKPDKNNPKGYYELEGGKIINKLIDKKFPFEKYKGKFIKITSYGLKFLPPGKYTIIYSERNIEEILDSMEKMARIKDNDRQVTKKAFTNLNNLIKNEIMKRQDTKVLFLDYNQILSDPQAHINKLQSFLNINNKDVEKMIKTVDNQLYRQRRK